MKAFKFLLIIVTMGLLIACGGGKQLTHENTCIPEWFLNPPSDPNYLFASNQANSKQMQLALDKAAVDARAEIGRQYEVKIKNYQKKFDEEIGDPADATINSLFSQVTKTVVSTVLSGSQIIKKNVCEKDMGYDGFVLVQYPVGAANEAFLQQLKKNNELKIRYEATKAFEELEKEVEEYEKWKKEQGY